MRHVAAALVFLFASGCGELEVTWPQARTIPKPVVDPALIPTPTPAPAPPDFGDGHDGELTVTTPGTVVNTCVALVSASNDWLTIASATGMPLTGRLLVHQVQDDFATAGDPSPVLPGRAGTWQIVGIKESGATTMRVDPPLAARYVTEGTVRAQACTMPEFTGVRIVPPFGTIVAPQWNGSAGGVLAFFAQDLVDVGGNLSVDGRGFRGGVLGTDDLSEDVMLETTPAGQGAGKGESLDGRAYALLGRGNMGNGGGGGNASEAGGGGGANGGDGGYGGKQSTGNGDEPETRGRGGIHVVDGVLQRITFGGGGGSGHGDGGVAVTPGADGGGAILVFARRIEGGANLTANGGTAADAGDGGTNADGAGGGGGGGTILVVTSSSGFTGVVRARGGAGGNVLADDIDYRRGVGGGGGGGRIRAPGLAGATFNVTAGLNGENVNCTADKAWGAGPGTAGVVEIQ